MERVCQRGIQGFKKTISIFYTIFRSKDFKQRNRISNKQTSQTKPMGPNELSTEMIKTLEDTGVDALHTFFNKMYDPGEIPPGMAKSIFITLTKKKQEQKNVKNITQSS